MKILRPHLFFTLFYGLIFLLFLWPLLALQKTFTHGDYWVQFYPWSQVFAHGLKTGDWPYWTRLVGLGFPLVAEGQVAAYYLPNIAAFALLPFRAAYTWSIPFHILIGGLAFYFYAQKIGQSKEGAALSAILYSFGSTYGGCFYTTGTLRALTWLPAALLILEQAASERQKRKLVLWTSLLAVSVSWMWTAGFPQVALYAALYLALYSALTPSAAKKLVVLACGGVSGMALAFPQVAATLELAKLSTRAGQDAGFALWGSLMPPAFLAALFPSLNGVFSVSFYIGILPFFLAASVFFFRKNPWERAFGWLALIFALLALGRYNPVYRFLIETFPLTALRNPAKFLFFCTASLAVLAGFGFDRCFGARPDERTVSRLRGLWSVFFVVVAVFPFAASWVFTAGQDLWAETARRIAERVFVEKADPLQGLQFYQDKADLLLGSLGEALAWRHPRNEVTLLFAAAALVTLLARRTRFLKPAVFLIVIADLYLFGSFALGAPAGAGFVGNARPAPKVDVKLVGRIQELQAQAGGVIVECVSKGGRGPLEPSSNMLFGIRHAGAYSPLLVKRYYELVKDLGVADSSLGKRPFSEEIWTQQRKILDAAGVTLIVSDRRLELPGLEQPEKVSGYFIYRNAAARPQLYRADSWKKIEDKNERLAYLKGGTFNPSREAVVEESPPPGEDTLMVFINTFYPRWKVTVDGAPRQVVPVNHAFCGVFVPPGKHEVRFYYDKNFNKTAEKVSWAAWAVLLSMCAAAGAWTGKK